MSRVDDIPKILRKRNGAALTLRLIGLELGYVEVPLSPPPAPLSWWAKLCGATDADARAKYEAERHPVNALQSLLVDMCSSGLVESVGKSAEAGPWRLPVKAPPPPAEPDPIDTLVSIARTLGLEAEPPNCGTSSWTFTGLPVSPEVETFVDDLTDHLCAAREGRAR